MVFFLSLTLLTLGQNIQGLQWRSYCIRDSAMEKELLTATLVRCGGTGACQGKNNLHVQEGETLSHGRGSKGTETESFSTVLCSFMSIYPSSLFPIGPLAQTAPSTLLWPSFSLSLFPIGPSLLHFPAPVTPLVSPYPALAPLCPVPTGP